MKQKVKERTIVPSFTLLDAMKKMDSLGIKTLLVFDEKRFIGILTIGDIQRAIIKGVNLSISVNDILDKNKIYASVSDSRNAIMKSMKSLRAECMPVLNENGDIVDVLFWKDIFLNDNIDTKEKINLPVVIMAGGKGTR